MTGRETAWRVLAHEFESSVQEEVGTGERAAHHLLSPLGARMNRVLIVGTLAVPESVGRDPSAPFLRARLSDPTGAFTVTAGGFQPKALAAFQAIREPLRSLVVGKAHLYTGRDGVVTSSVRAEGLRTIGEPEYRETLSEALRHTLRRLELVEEMRDRRGPEDVREAARAGIPPLWFTGARTAVGRYPPSDLAPFREALGRAARELLGEPAYAAVQAVGHARVTRTVAPEPAAAPSAAVRAEEASFLDIVDDLAERSADGYADLREAMQLAERRGVTGDRAEELLNALEESGVLEEPIVGKLRRA